MSSDPIPYVRIPPDDIHQELRILREAYQLLMDVGQFHAETHGKIIAMEVENLLVQGKRITTWEDDARAQAQIPRPAVAPPPVVEGYEAVPMPDYAPIYFRTVPPEEGM